MRRMFSFVIQVFLRIWYFFQYCAVRITIYSTWQLYHIEDSINLHLLSPSLQDNVWEHHFIKKYSDRLQNKMIKLTNYHHSSNIYANFLKVCNSRSCVIYAVFTSVLPVPCIRADIPFPESFIINLWVILFRISFQCNEFFRVCPLHSFTINSYYGLSE